MATSISTPISDRKRPLPSKFQHDDDQPLSRDMTPSENSSDLSEPPSPNDSDNDDTVSTPGPSSRPSVDLSHDQDQPSVKRRKIGGPSLLSAFERAASSQVAEDDDAISLSSDGYSSGPGSPSHGEYALRDEAQTLCMWKDCDYGDASNNDELVQHVQAVHCAAGPKKTKYICEWGECQKKNSYHPSGYALKAHMRSHTKEKPYYCALPECDKSFTRSDALAKHMRTVHEPEPIKGAGQTFATDGTPHAKSKGKSKLSNGTSSTRVLDLLTPSTPQTQDDTDDHGQPNNDIRYVPAYHPVTGQPGFMIHYPVDVIFTAWESTISADSLMRVLRRQIHWAQQELDRNTAELGELDEILKDEWRKKEIVLEGLMEVELARVPTEDLISDVGLAAAAAIENDFKRDLPWNQRLQWKDGPPTVRPATVRHPARRQKRKDIKEESDAEPDVVGDATMVDEASPESDRAGSQSPPPTRRSGGFDGDADPYDNYNASRLAAFEERKKKKQKRTEGDAVEESMVVEGVEQRAADEADAVGALMVMSNGQD